MPSAHSAPSRVARFARAERSQASARVTRGPTTWIYRLGAGLCSVASRAHERAMCRLCRPGLASNRRLQSAKDVLGWNRRRGGQPRCRSLVPGCPR